MTHRSWPWMAALSAGAALALPAGALAAPPTALTCTGSVQGGTYASVTVPADANCDLANLTVLGDVSVQTNANLSTDGSGRIGGNVAVGNGAGYSENTGWTVRGTTTAQSAYSLVIDGASRDVLAEATGSIELSQATIRGSVVSDAGSYGDVFQSAVSGNVVINGSVGEFGEAGNGQWYVNGGSTIGGNVVVTNNQVPTDVDSNTIRGNLVCANNTPPTVVYANTIGGAAIGCANPATAPAS